MELMDESLFVPMISAIFLKPILQVPSDFQPAIPEPCRDLRNTSLKINAALRKGCVSAEHAQPFLAIELGRSATGFLRANVAIVPVCHRHVRGLPVHC